MLSLFPQILFLAPFSALVIRVALGLTLAYAAWRHLARAESPSRALGVIEAAVALVLALGAWTQAAALIGAIATCIQLAFPRVRTLALGTALLALVMCLSLLVTGAGIFAFDLPL